MHRLIAGVAVGWLLFIGPGWSQPLRMNDGEKLAPEVGPTIYRATATEEKGKVVVQLTGPSFRLAPAAERKPRRDWVYVWEDLKPLTLGGEVQAFNQAGKPLGNEAVVKALAKPVSVACFVLGEGDPDKPDPVYLEVLRDDVVILVFKGAALLR